MRNQEDVDTFTLAFHRQAVARLRQRPELLEMAVDTLDRWKLQRGSTASDPYSERWRALLEQGPDAIEQSTCTRNDDAATLRNVSPLGFVLSSKERAALHKLGRASHAA